MWQVAPEPGTTDDLAYTDDIPLHVFVECADEALRDICNRCGQSRGDLVHSEHVRRIALVEAPGDAEAQLEAARAHASFVRWEAQRARTPLAIVK